MTRRSATTERPAPVCQSDWETSSGRHYSNCSGISRRLKTTLLRGSSSQRNVIVATRSRETHGSYRACLWPSCAPRGCHWQRQSPPPSRCIHGSSRHRLFLKLQTSSRPPTLTSRLTSRAHGDVIGFTEIIIIRYRDGGVSELSTSASSVRRRI